MTNEQYRRAFFRLQPSAEAEDRLLNIPNGQGKARRSIRWGVWAAAAALTVLLLSGAVYAAASWFRLSRTAQSENGTVISQNDIQLEDQGAGNYIGFTLNGWSLPQRKDGGSLTLKELLETRSPESQSTLDAETLEAAYVRYFPITEENELLCIEVLDRDGLGYRDYYTRYETELVREGKLNGMETVWLRVQEPSLGETFHLFCRSEALHCILVVSSDRSFARAEEAASHVTLADSGVPIERRATSTVRGLKLPDRLEALGFTCREKYGMNLSAQQLADPETDLTGLYRDLAYTREADGVTVQLWIEDYCDDYENVGGFQLTRREAQGERTDLWFETTPDGTALLCQDPEGFQIALYINQRGEAAEAFLKTLSSELETAAVEITAEAPLEFTGLSQG